MRRRTLLAALAWPAASHGQARARGAAVGVLRATAAGARDATSRLLAALSRRGYEEGRNLTVVRSFADGRLERLPALARELVAKPIDVIVAVGSAAALAVRDTSTRTPLVFFGNFDPVRLGLVPALARPGGTATGVLIAAQGTLAAKRLDLLREAVPGATRVGVLAPQDANFASQLDEVRRAAKRMQVDTAVVEVRNGDYERAFAELVAAKVQALFVGGHTFFARDGDRIVALAAKHRLPASYEWPEQAEAGGLMGYGADLDELYDRVAMQVERILAGTPAGEIPVEQPTKAELVVNLRTAQALGLAIPTTLLQRAARVVR